jgi:hypothetical protein
MHSMKNKTIRFSIFLSFFCFYGSIQAQESNANLIKEINQLLSLSAVEETPPFLLLDKTGVIEQQHPTFVQRLRLQNIGKIDVQKTPIGFNMLIECREGTSCIQRIRNDMSSSDKSSEAYFLSSINAANAIATKLHALVQHYNTGKEPIAFTLLEDQSSKSSIPSPTVTKKSKLQSLTEEEDTEEVKDEPVKKVTPKNRKTSKENEEVDESEPNEEEENPKKKSSAKKQRVLETMPIDIEENASSSFCTSLQTILKAGQHSSFKELEGKETNADLKINESKQKLRGAKRTYLSWFKKQRACVAEFKTTSEYELLIAEFEKLQTEIENCFEGHWEDIDHANDAIYEKSTVDIKDIEYMQTNGSSTSSIRIAIHSANHKHTLFVRIQ